MLVQVQPKYFSASALLLGKRSKKVKEISKNDVKKLVDRGYIRNTKRGYVSSKGDLVGYKRTVNKRYIEDYYFDLAQKL